MSERILPQDFYVYLHRKETTGEVFYVGKGFGRRAWVFSGRSEQWQRTYKKHGAIVQIVQDGLQEWASFEIEQDLIAFHGKRSDGTGLLVNNCDGGSGNSGAILSEQTRKKISIARKGMKLSEEHKKRVSLGLTGKKRTEAEKQKMRAAKLGKQQTAEHVKNRMMGRSNAAKKGLLLCKKGRIVKHETGFVFKSSNNARRWLEQFGGVSTSSAGFCTAIKSGKPYKGHLFT
jgi:hypothetical protein